MSNKQKETKPTSETGHVEILFSTVLASVLVVVMMLGLKNGNDTLAWVGGIGTALMLMAQFVFVHKEFGMLWAKIEELEKK